jgi:hypothetical protein
MSSYVQSQSRPTYPAYKLSKRKILCGSCTMELAPDHTGIKCIQGHHFCTDCSKYIVKLFLSDLQTYMPLYCVECKVGLNSQIFERQLTPEQLDFYHQLLPANVRMKDLVGEGERLDNCPFCGNEVIRRIYDTSIFNCNKPDCGKTSCLICRKECPKFLNG